MSYARAWMLSEQGSDPHVKQYAITRDGVVLEEFWNKYAAKLALKKYPNAMVYDREKRSFIFTPLDDD